MRRRSSSDRHSELEREKEKERRRVAWMIHQEKEREHERLKQKRIEEYERKRAELLGLKRKRRSPYRSRSKSRSRSRSEESHHRSQVKHRSSRLQVMSEKINLSEGNKPLFSGPKETPKLDENELRQVVVNIHRKIPAPATVTSEIRRDIVNHEEITLKRRDGEGAKPIFDREELKQFETKSSEGEERRTIEAVGKNTLVRRSYSKRRSASLSPRRHRTPSPHAHSNSRSSSHRSRFVPKVDKNEHVSNIHRNRRSEKEYREYRGRSKDRSYDRRDRRDSSRERRLPPDQYAEQMSFPVYYSAGFAPRPMLVVPAIPPFRGPLPDRGRPPMAPIRPPFPPRFIGPQDIYRAVLPPDPRFGRMY